MERIYKFTGIPTGVPCMGGTVSAVVTFDDMPVELRVTLTLDAIEWEYRDIHDAKMAAIGYVPI